MTDEELAKIKEVWEDDSTLKSHYKDCLLYHPPCCIMKLLDEVHRLKEELARERRYRKGYTIK